MTLALGIDLCAIGRVQDELRDPDRGFRDAVFTPAEIADCERRHRPAPHYAVRFAAKEALVKALAAAGGRGAFWRDIEITGDPPGLVLSGRAAALAAAIGVVHTHVAMARAADLATATVVLESHPPRDLNPGSPR